MKYLKNIFLFGIIVALCSMFLVSEVFNVAKLGLYSRVLIFPFLILYYILKGHNKSSLLTLFLVFFSLAEIILFLVMGHGLYNTYGSLSTYTGTSLYILAYGSLFAHIIYKVKLKRLYDRFPLHILVLSIFGLYLLYALDNMVKHHGLASMPTLEYVLATVYNIAIILVLISSLLGYLYHENRKALLLFIACMCVVFSELVQTAYFFMAREILLNLVYTALLSVGFLMFGIYIGYKNKIKTVSEDITPEEMLLSGLDTNEINI